MNINLIGVPTYYGCDRQGVEQGPSSLRANHIIQVLARSKYEVYDLGDISIPKVSQEQKYEDDHHMKFLNPIVEINNNLADQVHSSLKQNNFPLIIGGDHSLGLGSVAGASKFFDNLAVIWIDAHGDINTDKTSPSGNIHGMPLAASMNIGHPRLTNIYFEGEKVKPRNTYLLGPRDLDPGEVQLAKDLDLNLYTMDIIRENGLENILSKVIDQIENSDVDGVHLSFDIDVLDSSIVPGTGTPVANGFQLDEVNFILSKLFKEGFIRSMDFVELNPLLDHDDNRTIKNCMKVLEHLASVIYI